LAETEEHLSQSPTRSEKSIRLLSKLISLFHQPMTQRDIEVQSSFSESFWEIPIVGVEEMII
jgi:hypothetical protein